MSNFAQIILRHGRPLQVTRHDEGAFVNGRYEQDVNTAEIPIIGSLQPMDLETLQMLPEGERTRAKWILYCVSPLQVVSDPDHIMADGVEYEVQGIENWSHDGNYYRYVLMQIANQA